ncbi:hypothetical protein EV126DRAFT_518370 [Verticillium dahliae]|uniref:C2H2-type domain-containing protein n=1 Tax=Verticillium dahliae TaxID=27337 RepID=A0AA45APA8_VERDA|nr:hypothetical protein EV126DRAFT_518370 [Verticillium dahliae]PNH34120.1 hypothetical protein BJF96_g2541 [Verticillium dahliae]PNH55354.1 hypothetical protein VD0003_g2263 [Verticillium dahliae]
MAPPTTSSDGIVTMSLSDEDDQEGTSPATELPLDQSEHSTFDTLGLRAERIARRSTIAPRALDKGGIAGVVVGVCVAVSLVCLCFWPFIIRRIKAKKQQHQANLATSDAEANHAPVTETETAAGQEPHAHRPATQHSSRDSLSHKEDPFGGPGRQSSKELDLNADNGPEHQSRDGASTLHQRGPSDHLVVERNQVIDRRHSGTSFGQNPTWNSQGHMPITPGGIELITTRADGMEYSDVINGQSASYYSPTEPTENFGMVTPPQADEAQFPVPARSNSRTSSFKYNLMSMVRRLSSKDAAKTQTPSPTMDSFAAAPSRTMGPPIHPPHGIISQDLSESPVTHTPPQFRDFNYPLGQAPTPTPAPAPDSSVVLPASPVSTTGAEGPPLSWEPKGSPTPKYPDQAFPGTVNPMDVWGPSNQSEHVWRTNQELYYIEHPDIVPPQKSDPQVTHMDCKQPQADGSVPAQSAHGDQRVSEELPARAEAVVKQEALHEAHQYAAALQPDANHNITVPDVPAAQDYTHLMPATHNRVPSVDGNLTDPSDHTTPMASGMSSGPSVQNTPNTHLTEITPSPRSDGIPDIRNSSSPYAGSSGSPRSYACDQCHRSFDQVHKLNHHKRYHDRPHKCEHKGCDKQFGTKTHLDRHINDKHTKLHKFHCLDPTCLYSKVGGKGFPRKDNWRRHMINKHSINPTEDPEPHFVDETMTGT